MTDITGLPTDLYVRDSEDPYGTLVRTDRQETDGRAFVASLGGDLREVISDSDVGAFKRRRVRLPDGTVAYRVVRPGWERVTQRLISGTTKVLVVDNLDRMVRDPRDLEDCIDWVEKFGVTIVSRSGDIDLTTDHGVSMARMLVLHANMSSRDTSRRVKNGVRSAAQRGQLRRNAPPAFGWDRDDRVTAVPAEAEAIRTASADVLAGVALSSLARRWNDADLATATGGRWTPQAVRRVLTSPRTAGYVTYLKEPAVRDGVRVSGPQDVLVDVPTWEAVRELLNQRPSPQRSPGRPGARKYLLSGLVRCHCGAPMEGNYDNRQKLHRYKCPTPINAAGKSNACGRVGIQGPRLDRLMTALLLGVLGGQTGDAPGEAQPWPRQPELDALREGITATMDRIRDGRLSAARGYDQVQGMEARESELLAERNRFVREQARVSSVPVRAAAEWPDMSLDQQQHLMAQQFSAVVVSPSPIDVRNGQPFRQLQDAAFLARVQPVKRLTH